MSQMDMSLFASEAVRLALLTNVKDESIGQHFSVAATYV